MKITLLIVISFVIGILVGNCNQKERIVYRTQTDPNSIPRATFDKEIATTRTNSYNSGYAEGRRVGLDEGYKSGYVQGIEYGKSLILEEIDLRRQEAERTNQNIPLFRVRRE